MQYNDKKETSQSYATDDLRRLITENPRLPLLVFCGKIENGSRKSWVSCDIVKAELGEFLDLKTIYTKRDVYTDRREFERDLSGMLNLNLYANEEAKNLLKDIIALHDPYWKPCIILYAGN